MRWLSGSFSRKGTTQSDVSSALILRARFDVIAQQHSSQSKCCYTVTISWRTCRSGTEEMRCQMQQDGRIVTEREVMVRQKSDLAAPRSLVRSSWSRDETDGAHASVNDARDDDHQAVSTSTVQTIIRLQQMKSEHAPVPSLAAVSFEILNIHQARPLVKGTFCAVPDIKMVICASPTAMFASYQAYRHRYV
jgi:hypothetical protein